MDEVGNLLAVNPDLDSRAFRFYEILVPLAVLKVLVRLAAILRSHPSIAGLAVDVTGFRPFSPTRLDLNLRTIHPLLGIIILGLGPDLHPRVQSVVTLDLKRQFKISIFFVCAQKRVGTSLRRGSNNGPVYHLICGRPIALGKSTEVLAIEKILPAGFLMMIRHTWKDQKMGKQQNGSGDWFHDNVFVLLRWRPH